MASSNVALTVFLNTDSTTQTMLPKWVGQV